MQARTIILSRYAPTTGPWIQRAKAQLSRRLGLASRKHSQTLLVNEVINTQAHMSKHITNASFDTDSGPVGIDNHCSVCMSNKSSEFYGELWPVKRVIKGFGGSRTYNVPKSQRLKNYAWLTHGIQQVTDTITEWEVRQNSRNKLQARTIILGRCVPTKYNCSCLHFLSWLLSHFPFCNGVS